MKMTLSVLGIFGATARQMSMVRGVDTSESGSTSPKKRNSVEDESCRMEKAEDM